MKILHLKSNEINKSEWDKHMLMCSNATVYGSSAYLDIVSENWEALVSEDYNYIFPITRKKKWGIHYILPPYFTQQLGVFGKSTVSAAVVEAFLNALPSDISYVQILLNCSNPAPKNGFKIKENINCELDLNFTYSELFKKYSENTKRNIKKARAFQLSQEPAKIDEIITLFKKNKGREIANLNSKSYKLLELLCNKLMMENKLYSTGIYKNGQLCSGVIWIAYKNKRIFLFSASNELAKKEKHLFFLIDEYIKEQSYKELILDFEGSNNKNLARFYNGFGAKEYVYLQVIKNKLPGPLKWLKER